MLTIAENVPLAARRFPFPKPIVTDRGERINPARFVARAGRDLNFESLASACRSPPFDEVQPIFVNFEAAVLNRLRESLPIAPAKVPLRSGIPAPP